MHIVFSVEHIDYRAKACGTVVTIEVQAVFAHPPRDPTCGHTDEPSAHHNARRADQTTHAEEPTCENAQNNALNVAHNVWMHPKVL